MRKLAFYLLVLLLFPVALLAQGDVAGRITGIVTDSSGAAIQGAEVTATGPALLKPKMLKSVSGGVYLLEDLPPGSYQLTAAMPGFKNFRQEGIILTAGFTATVNVPLSTGDASETITVTDAPPIIDVQGGETSTTFDSALLADTPSGNDPWSTLEQTPV